MESDLPQQHHHQHLHQSHQRPAGNPGLTRFRSAPSCFFTNILESVLDREFCEDFLNRPSSPETGRILSRLMSGEMDDPAPPPAPNPGNLRRNSPPRNESAALRPPLAGSIKSEPKVLQQNDFSAAPYYQSSPQPPLPNWNTNYEAAKMGRGNNSSNLIRQSSSPAGLFSNINIDSGYGTMRGTLGAANAETALHPATRFGSQPDSLARVSSSMAQMTPIAEVGDRRMGDSIQEADPFGESDDFIAGFPVSSWDDSENYGSLKRGRGSSEKNSPGLNASDALVDDDLFLCLIGFGVLFYMFLHDKILSFDQNDNIRSGPPQMLAHHLSLPKSSAEMSAIEKLLQDSVPCKIRAKRGCATHPRSIAERVRRTKISERMRKLQDLVPNMDKQTNTADMLDLAVEYIKDLQQQVKMLSANRAACTCSSTHQL